MLLGALAGFTIFLGLPAGRIKLLSDRARVGLAMFSVGILAFIFVDVLEHGLGIVDSALGSFKEGGGSFGHLAALTLLLIVGFGLGSAGLGILERRLRPTARAFPPIRGGPPPPRLPPPPEAPALPADGRRLDRHSVHPRRDRAARQRDRAREAPRAPDRPGDLGRDRPPQLRRGPRHRRLGALRRGEPRDRPDHRLRAPQRHRGLWHRWPARLRHTVLALARARRPHRRRPDLP